MIDLTFTTSAYDHTKFHFIRIEISSPESIKNFLLLVNRATNTWDSAPKEIKELADLLTHQKVTQDHTPQPMIKITQSDYRTPVEISAIEEFIQLAGQEAWLEHLRNGTVNEVLRPTS